MWERLAHEFPALVILAMIVFWIMRSQKDRDKAAAATQSLYLEHIKAKDALDSEREKAQQAQEDKWLERISTLGRECHDFQERMQAQYHASVDRQQAKLEAFVDKMTTALSTVTVELREAVIAFRTITKP